MNSENIKLSVGMEIIVEWGSSRSRLTKNVILSIGRKWVTFQDYSMLYRFDKSDPLMLIDGGIYSPLGSAYLSIEDFQKKQDIAIARSAILKHFAYSTGVTSLSLDEMNQIAKIAKINLPDRLPIKFDY